MTKWTESQFAEVAKRQRRLRLTPTEPTEAQVMRSIIERLRRHPNVVMVERMNTGAGRVLRKDGTASQWMRFGFPGCPDVVAWLKDGRTAWIEVKRPSGVVREAQAAFIDVCLAHGIPAGIARSMDDAVAIIEARP